MSARLDDRKPEESVDKNAGSAGRDPNEVPMTGFIQVGGQGPLLTYEEYLALREEKRAQEQAQNQAVAHILRGYTTDAGDGEGGGNREDEASA